MNLARFGRRLSFALFHAAEDFGHVFDAGPNFVGDVDRGLLLDSDGDAVAGAGVDLEDLFLGDLVLGGEDEAGVVDAVAKVINDHAVNVGTEGEEDIGEEIVGLRAFFRRALLEHSDGGTNGLIDVNDEDLVLVTDEHGRAPTGGKHDLNFDLDYAGRIH